MRRVALAALMMVLLLLPAATARADGDPASDVLLTEDVFVPYAPNAPSHGLAGALRQAALRARAKGLPVKVALISGRRDLGAYGQLAGRPQFYAKLLTAELAATVARGVQDEPRVLVVMPVGLGSTNFEGPADLLAHIVPGPGAKGDALARVAISALVRLTTAAGKPIAAPSLPQAVKDGTGSGGGTSVLTLVIFGGPVLLVVLAAVFLNRRRHDLP